MVSRADLDAHWNCRVTTIGRKTGQPRTVTVWFVLDGATLYLTGNADGPQWTRNMRANGQVSIQIGGTELRGQATVIDDEAQGEEIRQRFLQKYLLAKIGRALFGGYTRSVAVVVALEQE